MANGNTIVGLDLGRYAVKAVWIDRRGRAPTVKRCESVRVPAEGAERADVIKRWIDKVGLERTPCVIGLPGQQAMFQPFLLPPGDPRNLEQAAAMEVVKFNEMASETMSYDFSGFETGPETRRLLLAMARPSVLEEALGFARDMGLQIVDLVPAPVALFNALSADAGDMPRPQLFINVGHSSTEVAVGGDMGLMFARATAAGGQLFTEAIARTRNLSYSQAENVKAGEGSLHDGNALSETMQRAAGMWASEVESCLAVYRSLFNEDDAQPAKAVLCGGGARLEGMAAFVGKRLRIETSVTPIGDGELDFTVARGLALAGHKTCRTRMSLLPMHVRDELMFRVQKPFWITAATAAALILAVSLLGGYRDTRRQEAVLNEQRTSLRRRQKLVNEIETVEARGRRIQAMASPVKDMLRGSDLLRDVTTLVSTAITDQDWITMICDEKSYYDQAEPSGPGEAPRPGRPSRRTFRVVREEDKPNDRLNRIVIEGYTHTPNLSTVQELIKKLEAAAFVESADLLSDDEVVARDGPAGPAESRSHLFVIDVKLSVI